MSLDAISANSNSSILALFKQRRDALKGMEAAVQSGDMGTAQQDLSTVQQAGQTLQSSLGSSSTSSESNPFKTMMKTDLTGLMSAVASGDASASQAALQKLKSDQQANISPSNVGPSTSSPGQGSPFLDNLNALLSAAMTGDTKGAQSAANVLNSEVQSAFGQSSSTINSSTPTSTSTSTPSAQSAFMTDLQSLINAAQSGDQTATQKAAQTLAGDIKSALGGASGPGGVGGHHHHHHHAPVQSTANPQSTVGASGSASTDADGDSDASTATAAASPTATTSTSVALANAVTATTSTDPDGDGNVGQSGATSTISEINSAARNALKAYSMLMNYVNQSASSSTTA